VKRQKEGDVGTIAGKKTRRNVTGGFWGEGLGGWTSERKIKASGKKKKTEGRRQSELISYLTVPLTKFTPSRDHGRGGESYQKGGK